MQGTVKWFSSEKGYGFITGEDDIDRFFHVREVQGTDLPANGYLVEFEHKEGKRGPKALKIDIVQKIEKPRFQARRDDRVECNWCHRRMVPRLIFSNGRVRKSVCPFCGQTYKDFGGCFIATAVYGNYAAPEVLILRNYRDQYLMKRRTGQWAVKVYYRISPSIARIITKSPGLRRQTKIALDRLVRWLEVI